VQSTVTGGWQLPNPSQVVALVCVLPVQLATPQEVVLSGMTQAPLVASQSVAPHGAVMLAQAAVQQCPLPAIPHTPEVQASFSVQAPVAIGVVHAPPLQTKPVAQPVLEVHVVLQLVASAQAKLLGQAAAVPGVQVPLPLQALVVSMPPLQLAVPQVVVLGG
jgi:hypothetical protein